MIGRIRDRDFRFGLGLLFASAVILYLHPYIILSLSWILFLVEPRFRLALIFAVTGVLLQIGLWLININWVTSLANVIYIIVLRAVFAGADNVMHPPPSPIFNSGNCAIIGFFVGLILLSLLAAYFLTRFFHDLQTKSS